MILKSQRESKILLKLITPRLLFLLCTVFLLSFTCAYAADSESVPFPPIEESSQTESALPVIDIPQTDDLPLQDDVQTPIDIPAETQQQPNLDTDGLMIALDGVSSRLDMLLDYCYFWTYGLFPLLVAVFLIWQGCKWFFRTFVKV